MVTFKNKKILQIKKNTTKLNLKKKKLYLFCYRKINLKNIFDICIGIKIKMLKL
jgi:hypothetical protein